ncbi:hypothetical protein vseg_004084 [Gypsophila vaccaria]
MALKMAMCCFTNTLQNSDELVHPKQSPNNNRVSLVGMSSTVAAEFSINDLPNSIPGSNLHVFSHDELRLITNNFSSNNYLGGGGFGAVYKGFIHDKVRPGLEAQVVAVKVLDLEGTQGHKEWLAEVIYLGQLRHPHLVKLFGYSCENDQRLLVYEYMARGNLDKQLFSRQSVTLPWLTRIKIALEAAKGLAYLHDLNKPVIFRDFKGANILLDANYTAKLSDFGFARDGPEGDKSHVSTKNIVGTNGYAAPEYIMTGHLTTMSDVYSYGVVLLELLTGRKSLDKIRPKKEQNLVDFARPQLKDPKKVDSLMDPRLEGQYSTEGSKIAALLAYQCLSRQAKSRPRMSSVIKVLEPLLELKDMPTGYFVYVAPNNEGQKIRDGSKNVHKNGEKNEGVAVEQQKEKVEKVKKVNDEGKNEERQRVKDERRVLRSRAVYSDSVLGKVHHS